MRILAATLVVVACALPACKKERRAQPPAPSAPRPSPPPPEVVVSAPPVGPIPVDLPAAPGTQFTVTIAMTELAVTPTGGKTSHFPLRPDGRDDLDGFTAALPSPPPAGSQAIIAADGDVTHRRVVAVLDALKQRGFTRIALSVTK